MRQYIFRVLVLHGPASLCDIPPNGYSHLRDFQPPIRICVHILVISAGFRPSQRLCRFFVMMLTHVKSDGGKVEVPPSFFS